MANAADGEPFPPFDIRGFNPIGWRRDSDGETVALGNPGLLPAGITARKAVAAREIRRLRRADAVADIAAFHDGPASRAAILARLAALGVAVHIVDRDPRLEALLGERLHRILASDPRGTDAFAREIRAVRASRESTRRHSGWARERLSGRGDFSPCASERLRGRGNFPLVSVLLSTKRPEFLAWALAGAASQTYPRIELILALHGDGFDDAERRLAGFPHPVKTLRIPTSQTLGAALNAASEAAGGGLLTKMDDDDFYDPEHIWDLVLARAYSGADLAGKGIEHVYLAASDRTARLSGGGERYWTHALAGGTMLITRRALARAGGWRNVPAGVDVALLADALRSGARVYRASGIGYILVRHGVRHIWSGGEIADAAILAKASRVWDGLRLDAAGVAKPGGRHPADGRA